MPRIPTKPGSGKVRLTTDPQRHSRDQAKLPTPAPASGEYRARGTQKASAKSRTNKTRTWRGK